MPAATPSHRCQSPFTGISFCTVFLQPPYQPQKNLCLDLGEKGWKTNGSVISLLPHVYTWSLSLHPSPSSLPGNLSQGCKHSPSLHVICSILRSCPLASGLLPSGLSMFLLKDLNTLNIEFQGPFLVRSNCSLPVCSFYPAWLSLLEIPFFLYLWVMMLFCYCCCSLPAYPQGRCLSWPPLFTLSPLP